MNGFRKFERELQHRAMKPILCALTVITLAGCREHPNDKSKPAARIPGPSLGISLTFSDPYPKVRAVLEGSPAHRCEMLQSDMLLLAICEGGSNGVFCSTRRRSQGEISRMLGGAAGTRVGLEFAESDENGELKLVTIELQREELVLGRERVFITRRVTRMAYGTEAQAYFGTNAFGGTIREATYGTWGELDSMGRSPSGLTLSHDEQSAHDNLLGFDPTLGDQNSPNSAEPSVY